MQSLFDMPTDLTVEQRTCADAIHKIINSEQHAFSRLKSLEQKGIILGVTKEEKPISKEQNCNAVIISAIVQTNEQPFQAECDGLSLAVAKKQASLIVLHQIATHLHDNPPSSMCPPTRTAPLTSAEQALRKHDATHEAILGDMLEHFYRRDRSACVLSIDLEQFDQDHSINLETGIACAAIADICDSPQQFRVEHIINSSAMHLANTHVADNRFQFDFGESIFVPQEHIKQAVTLKVQQLTSSFTKVYFVGHETESEEKWLKAMGLDFMAEVEVCDVGRIYRYINNPLPYNKYKMEKMLRGLSIEYSYLHNGGNDAVYNLLVLGELLAGYAWNWPADFINTKAHSI